MTIIDSDMPNAAYHKTTAVGSSGLKLMEQSMLHYWAQYVDPERVPKDPTLAMRIGTAWHAAVFEPEKFAEDYVAKPDINALTKRAKLLNEVLEDGTLLAKLVEVPEGLNGRSKEGKALFAEIEEAGNIAVEATDMAFVSEWHPKLAGKQILSIDDLARVNKMAASARSHPISRIIFERCEGFAEQSIFWTEPTTGVACKIRPDYYVAPCELFPNGMITDGKSGEDASPDGFARSAWNWQMFYQAAFYVDGFQQAFGTEKPPVFMWMSQEKEAPFATAYYSASDDFLAYGRRKYRPLLRKYAECLASGVWPGYASTVHNLELPVWAQREVQATV